VDAERRLLALGDPRATPRRRADRHGLPLPAYLALVYPPRPQASCLRCRRALDAEHLAVHAMKAHGYRRAS
jgi:hypothetical protein